MACKRMRLRKESKSILCMLFCNLFVTLVVLSSGLLSVSSCHDTERIALLHFKSMLTDHSDRLSSWHGRNCCNWQGIKCSKSGHVIVVNLRNPHPQDWFRNSNSELISMSNTTSTVLKGTLSPSLFTLKHIRHLDLSYNNLMFSKLPAEISSCTELKYLNLSNAMLEDFVTTQLANLTSLRSLDLSCAEEIPDASSPIEFNLTSFRLYTGPPSSYVYSGNLSSSNLYWVQGLRNLKVLSLRGVDLSKASRSTKWAEPISLLSNLKSLHLSNCKISGRIPITQFLNLTNLQELILDSNAFNSPVPDHLANITNLSILDFSNNDLYGSMPYLPQLKEFHVGQNPNLMIDLKTLFAGPWTNLEILDIDYTQVMGEIPCSIANITSLVYLSAASCSIQGSLPSSITNLSKLEVLRLDDNYITGNIPSSISNLKNLKKLSLGQNKIDGYIPEPICKIINLQYLSLYNNLLVGSLPECVFQLPHLLKLYTWNNKLAGTIPLSMFRQSNMTAITLGRNAFSVKVDQQQFQLNFQPQVLELGSCNIGGHIPDFISNLTDLVLLGLSNNSLSGTIPTWLFNLPKLSFLDLSKNMLEGVIPITIQLHSSNYPTVLSLARNKLQGLLPSQFKDVQVINLSVNNFTGHVPTELGEVLDTKFISLSDNNLTGEIPQSFCRAGSDLMVLDLSGNSLTGTIPPSIGNCTSLLHLNLGDNKLGGTIPDELAGAKNLAYLDLKGNHFRGSFPRAIQNYPYLESLVLADNRFEGRIPQFIGDLHYLRILDLAFNFFNESIPQELMRLEHLQYVSLSKNRLSGTIPNRMGGLTMLMDSKQQEGSLLAHVVSFIFAPFELEIVTKGLSLRLEAVHTYNNGIDLSSNALIGKIPDEICLLKGLAMLNLSRNALEGEIPQMIGEMTSLESLDLGFNNLNGEIPATLTLIDHLQWLNLSYNNLSGKVPSSPHFDTLSVDRSAYIENRYLCDVPGGLNCTSKASKVSKVPSSTATSDAGDEMPLQVLVGIVMLGFVTGTLLHFAILFQVEASCRDRYWRAIDKIALGILNYK